MNDELRDRTDEALQANSYLSSILSSMAQAVVVVDPQLRITKWSRAATDLWGLREDEIEGENLLNLDIGVPVGKLREPVWGVLAGRDEDPVVLDGHDRRGRPVRCEVSVAQLRSHLDEIQGAILVMATVQEGV
jgi:two-component system CheB/CheR fusion protein